MRFVDRIARALAFVLLIAAWADSGAAEFAAPVDDGWHGWQVEGPQDSVRIYVRIKDGSPTRIQFRNNQLRDNQRCTWARDDEPTEFQDHGIVDNDVSVAWLNDRVDVNDRISEDAIAAISAHAGDAAFAALTGLLEDRKRGKETREQALFWLAQSDSDEAFEYLDALISSN
jgi:hypothetical protein